MAVSTIRATIPGDVQKVWEKVTSLEDYGWRSDLSRIERLTERRFVEYTKEGYATTFTVTAARPYERWEFDMENDAMVGHWVGLFTAKGAQTEIEFTEDVTAKKVLMRPFLKGYLKKQQALYLADLKKALV